MLSLSFQSHRLHRHLFSFPTRRSSDLRTLPHCLFPSHSKRPLSTASVPIGRSGKIGSASNRSEEHTTELQSRPHLVCRLLLEKKISPPSHAPLRQAATTSSDS